MATNYNIFEFQLKDSFRQRNIITSGGKALVTAAGAQARATLYNPAANFAALANPIDLTYGGGKFAVLDTLGNVDIYVMGPEGDFVVVEDVPPGSIQEVLIDMSRREQMLKLPFSATDAGTGTTEFDTGFDLPTNCLVSPHGAGVLPVTADAGETLDVGLLSSEGGGDADGFIDGISIATAAAVAAGPAMTVGTNETFFASNTLGVLLSSFLAGADTASSEGSFAYKYHRIDGTAKSISLTPSSWDGGAAGYFFLPYILFGR